MTNSYNFRNQIKILMERRKISIAKLARKTDIHQETIYRYLRGQSEISAANLEKILNFLNSNEREENHGKRNNQNLL